MDRREFLGWVGVGCLASSLPVAIASCSQQNQTKTSTNSAEFQVVGTLTQLKAKGQLLDKKSSVGGILVIPDPANPDTLLAVNPTCTHEGCTVKWQGEKGNFVCPCHEAAFSPQGKVINSPAKEPLTTYIVKVEGDSILAKRR